jgi:hypothetical protein
MSRDPKVVGRARVGAETFAGVINSFVDPISWKTMGFTLVTLGFLIVLTNSALFNLRAKHMHAPVQQQQQPFAPFMMPPQISHMGSMAQLGYGGMHAEQMGVAGHLAGAGHGQDAAANGVNGPQSNANGNGNGNSGIAAKTLGWLGGK